VGLVLPSGRRIFPAGVEVADAGGEVLVLPSAGNSSSSKITGAAMASAAASCCSRRPLSLLAWRAPVSGLSGVRFPPSTSSTGA